MTLDETRNEKTIDTWQTPAWYLNRVRAIDPIGLDPCTTADNPTKAANFCAPPWDGLARVWSGLGLVFVNPPYGKSLEAWSKKIFWEAVRGSELVVLVPARPDTRWFDRLDRVAAARCFHDKRIRFVHPETGIEAKAPKFPNCTFYFGGRTERFRQAFSDCGRIYAGSPL